MRLRMLSLVKNRSAQPTFEDTRIKRWAMIAVVVALLALLIDQPLLLVLALLLALAAASAWCWWRFGLSEVTFHRQLSADRAGFGDEIEIELTVENAKPLPLVWLDVRDEFPAALPLAGATAETNDKPDRVTLRAVFSTGPYERVRRRYRVTCAARGRYLFGPATLQTGDPFGFSRRFQQESEIAQLIVFPEVLPLAAFGLPAELPLGERRPARPLIDDPFVVEGIRPYQAGDLPRQIHWRATARSGTLQTRRYERRASPSLALFLDANTFEHFWEGGDSELLERTISVAASVANWGLQSGYQVSLTANAPRAGSAEIIRVPASAQMAHLPRILEALALLVGGTGLRIETVIAQELPRLPFGMTVAIVTPRVTSGLQQQLAKLVQRGNRPVVIVSGAVPLLEPGLRGRVQLYHTGPETEERDDVSPLPLLG